MYFTLLVGVVFAVAYLRAQVNTRFLPTQIPGWKHFLRTPFMLLLVLLAAQGRMRWCGTETRSSSGSARFPILRRCRRCSPGYHFALKRGRQASSGG